MSVRTRTAAAAVAGGLVLGVVPGIALAGPANAATTTRIGIAANRSITVAGHTISLRIHLLNAPKGQVTLYRKYPGHSTQSIAGGQVDSDGYARVKVGARYTATFTAKYAGDADHTASSDGVHVTVRALTVARAFDGRKAGKYRSYAAGKKAHVAAAAGPNKHGKRLAFRLQRLTKAGHWKTRLTRSYKLNSKGAVAIYVSGASGRKYRVRASYAGDSLNASNHTSWVYVKFRK